MHFFWIETNQEIILTQHIHGKACIKEKAKDKLKIVGLSYQVFSSISFFCFIFERYVSLYYGKSKLDISHCIEKYFEKLHITI
jgi:hypothetical protein